MIGKSKNFFQLSKEENWNTNRGMKYHFLRLILMRKCGLIGIGYIRVGSNEYLIYLNPIVYLKFGTDVFRNKSHYSIRLFSIGSIVHRRYSILEIRLSRRLLYVYRFQLLHSGVVVGLWHIVEWWTTSGPVPHAATFSSSPRTAFHWALLDYIFAYRIPITIQHTVPFVPSFNPNAISIGTTSIDFGRNSCLLKKRTFPTADSAN